MYFGDPVGGQHLLLSKKQWRSYRKGDRGAVCGHVDDCIDEDESSDSDTSVCSGSKLGRSRGSARTVVSMVTTRPSASTRRKNRHFSRLRMNIQLCCDDV